MKVWKNVGERGVQHGRVWEADPSDGGHDPFQILIKIISLHVFVA